MAYTMNTMVYGYTLIYIMNNISNGLYFSQMVNTMVYSVWVSLQPVWGCQVDQ